MLCIVLMFFLFLLKEVHTEFTFGIWAKMMQLSIWLIKWMFCNFFLSMYKKWVTQLIIKETEMWYQIERKIIMKMIKEKKENKQRLQEYQKYYREAKKSQSNN